MSQPHRTTSPKVNVSLFQIFSVVCFVSLSLVGAGSFDFSSLLTDRRVNDVDNVDSDVVGEARIYSTTLVVNNSTVIRAVTFIIGSLLIMLPLLMVALLKLEHLDDAFGFSPEPYGGSHSSGFFDSGLPEYENQRRTKKNPAEAKNATTLAPGDKLPKGKSKRRLKKLLLQPIVNTNFVAFSSPGNCCYTSSPLQSFS